MQVAQASRRACSAAQRTLVHLARSALTPAHGNLYHQLAKQVGQFIHMRAGAQHWRGRRHAYHNAAVEEGWNI